MDRATRKRRSSSIVYHEPQETLEQLSDQAALPNLNAEWVNSKGGQPFISFIPRFAASFSTPGNIPHQRHNDCGVNKAPKQRKISSHAREQFDTFRQPSTHNSHVQAPLQTLANSVSRRMAHPPHFNTLPQDSVRHHPRRFAGDVMDPHESHLHCRLLPHVPLGARHPL
jgi:hypothetical protein